MPTLLTLSTLFALLATGAPAAPAAATTRPVDAVLARYEAVRTKLAADTVDGVRDDARTLVEALERLSSDFSAEAAGVSPERADDARTALPTLLEAARGLAAADGLAATRDAFYALTKPLVRYRELLEGPRPVVAYCPMADRSWLQPEGPIGNPYYGASMLRCGQVVSK